jgi:hypothetical protein
MDPTSLSIKSIYDAYQQFTKINEHNDTTFDNFFDTFATLLTKNVKSLGEFLTIFTPNVDSNNPTFIRFMDDFSFRLVNTNPIIGVNVLKTLLNSVRKLTIAKKISLTRFIWERQSFRSLIKYYPKSITGKLYMRESIFSNVFPNDGSLITDLDSIINIFIPLFTDKNIVHNLIQYIDNIFTTNIGYTYEDPNMMNQSIMSTTDMCILCFVVLINTIKSNYEDPKSIPEYVLKVFWNGINVVYITTHNMNRMITDSINYRYSKLKNLTELKNPTIYEKQEITNLKTEIKQGDTMVKNLTKYTSNIDTQYVEQMIFEQCEFMNYIIKHENYDIISRLINDIGQTSISTISKLSKTDTNIVRSRLSQFVFNILASVNIPVHIKFNAMRLVLSHNLKTNLIAIPNSSNTICKYILEDVARLKNLESIHLIDLMAELSDTTLMNRSDIMELYMYLLPDFSEQYVQILKMFLYSPDVHKPQIMTDLETLISATVLMVKNTTSIGKDCLSYIGDILSLIETISNTYTLVEEIITNDTIHTLSSHESVNLRDIKDLFKDFKPKYISRIIPLVSQMFKNLQCICKVIITKESNRILCDIFGQEHTNLIDSSNVKIIDTSQVPDNLIDMIKCDIALSPYYISTGRESNQSLEEEINSKDHIQYHLIDRKTYFGIIRSKMNPFTREPIDKKYLDKLNEQTNIKCMRNDILSQLLEI